MNTNKAKRNWWERLSLIIIIIVAVLALVYSIADALGGTDSIPWLKDRQFDLGLALLASIALFIISNYLGSLTKIEQKTSETADIAIPRLIDEFEARMDAAYPVNSFKFDDMADLQKFQNDEMKKATREILDLSWSNKISNRHEAVKDKKLDEDYEKMIDSISRKIVYKEIFMFNADGRKEKLQRRIEGNSPAYSCAYFEASLIPQLQFMVIDRNTVIFASSQYKMPIAIKDESIGTLFANYYDLVWDAATKIKNGDHVDQEVLGKIINISNGTNDTVENASKEGQVS